MNHRRELTVGITTGCLHDTHPRGVTRAARAVAERLATRTDLRLLAISDPVLDSGELVCAYHELSEWLSAHPLHREEHMRATTLRRAVGVGRRVLSAVGLKRPGKLAYRIARGAVRLAKPTPLPQQATPPEFVSVRDLDAALSFECYDPIWQWPLESYGCRTVGVFHDAIPLRVNEGADARPEEYLRAAGLMALRASVVCCDSQSTRDDLETFFPAARGRTRVVHLGHDAERFRGAEPRRATHTGKRVAMIGDIEPRKNQAGVLRAARHIASAHPGEPITLVLIGHPRVPYSLEFLTREAGRFVRVERTGYVPDDDLPALLRGCDCFVYPSLWEGFGMPVLEAMSAGVPVVCSDVSALPEVAGPHAIYCAPHDPRSIASGVNRALALSPAERAARTNAAREWAARFTWDTTANRFAEILVNASAGNRREAA